MKTKQKNRGVTLVEIAIVLVIIGLLLGGILKGGELIDNAKVKSIVERQNSLRVAWYAFIDRYENIPGDYSDAATYIEDAGNGDGDGRVREDESPLVFQHLTGSGFLRCSQCEATAAVKPDSDNSLQNQYGGVMSIWADSKHYAVLGSARPSNPRMAVHTGPRIPSNIIAEVEIKLDDGYANTGDFVFSQYDPSLTEDDEWWMLECMTTEAFTQEEPLELFFSNVMYWRHASASPPVEENCGGALRIQ